MTYEQSRFETYREHMTSKEYFVRLHESNRAYILRNAEESEEIEALRDENFSIKKLYEEQKRQLKEYQEFISTFMGIYPSQYIDVVMEHKRST